MRHKFLTITLLATALTACTLSRETHTAITNTADVAEKRNAEASSPRGPNPAAAAPVAIKHAVWLGSSSFRTENGDPLPAELIRPTALTLVVAKPLSLTEIGAEISQATGLKVDLVEGDPQRTQAVNGIGLAAETMVLNWRGPLNGLLDTIGTRFNVAWEYRGGVIRISKYETRTFMFLTLGSDTVVQNALEFGKENDTQGQPTGAPPRLGSQQLQTTTAVKIWDQIKVGLETIMSGRGRVSVSPSTGTITIVAPPDVMRQAASYVRLQNELRLRQVAVSVAVLNVRIEDSEDMGLDISRLLVPVFGKTVTAAFPAAGPFNLAILRNPAPTPQDQNQFSATIRALSSRANVSVATTAAVTTLNDQPAPVQVGTQTSYLASVSQVSTAQVGSTTTLTPGTVTSGFTMNVLPRIQGDGRLLLQFAISLTDLRQLRTIASGTSSIEVPEIDSRTFQQQVYLQSGDMLVLAGFEENQARETRAGTLVPENIFPAGRTQAVQRRTLVVILLSPEILPPPPVREIASGQ